MSTDACPWLERVSALVDNELPEPEAELVETHAQTCATCSRIRTTLGDVPHPEPATGSVSTGSWLTLDDRPLALRVFLGVAGAALMVLAFMNFVRGTGDDAGLHDLRHLAIWQASLGAAVIALSVKFRLSLFLNATIIAFLALTTAATVIDLVLGHRGPWTDVTHLLEAAALTALLFLARPRTRLLKQARRDLASSRD